MLQANNLHCERGGRALFSELSFSLEQGQALQIKGENGSGKTSLLRMLVGLASAESGSITWNLQAIENYASSYHKNLLFIGHKSGVNLQLSAEHNLNWYSKLHTLENKNFDEAFKRFGLFGFEDIPALKLSAGQRRRIALCRLIIEKKIFWILDEPLVSLDQKGIAVFEQLASEHLKNGGFLIFSSHQELSLGSEIKVLDLDAYKQQSLASEGSV